MIDDVEALMKQFNEEMKQNPGLRDGLMGLDRSIQIEFDDAPSLCHMRLVDGEVGFLCSGPMAAPERPDLRIITDSSTLKGIVEQSIDPIDAYRKDRIKIEGSFLDKLMLKAVLAG